MTPAFVTPTSNKPIYVCVCVIENVPSDFLSLFLFPCVVVNLSVSLRLSEPARCWSVVFINSHRHLIRMAERLKFKDALFSVLGNGQKVLCI